MSLEESLGNDAERLLTEALAGLVDAGLHEAEARKYRLLVAFLEAHPDAYSSRSRQPHKIGSLDFVKVTAGRFFGERFARTEPSLPRTVPDPIVGLVLSAHFGIEHQRVPQLERDHQAAMAAENVVGKLLERYLAVRLEQHGWVWCAGDFVKATDFVMRDDNGVWLALQVKNRDNSENSSSAAIRQGTTIEKWFRTFSRSGDTNWASFPGSPQKYGVSEDGFRQYVLAYFNRSACA